MEPILVVDRQLTAGIRSFFPHNTFFDTLFSFLSLRGITKIIWILIFLIFVYRLSKKDRATFTAYFTSSVFGVFILAQYLLKNLFHRLRPPTLGFESAIRCPSDFGFPSTHAAVAFAGAFILTSFDKKHWYLYYLIAIVISISRIYLGCHYLLDTIVGGVIGYCFARAILLIKPIKD